MADEKVLITESTLDNIANAIREKNGESFEYYPSEMPAAVRRIPTGGGGSGSVVAVFPILHDGEHIANIVVDGDTFALYAPTPIDYQEGTGIEISNGEISVSNTLISTINSKVGSDALTTIVNNLTAAIATKQDMLTAGQGITITGTTISADGTDVEANPTGTPTDELNTIRIGEDIYEIVGGGGGGSGYTATLLHDCQGSPSLSQVTLSDSWKNYDALYIEVMFNGEALAGNTKPRETLQKAADDRLYIGFVSFANTYVGLTPVNNDGVTLSFYGQGTNGVTRIFGLKYGSGGGTGGGSYSEEVIFTGSNSDSSPITLTKNINGFDLIQFVVSYTDHNTTSTYEIPVKYFVDNYPYSQFSSLATPNLTIALAGSEWFRIARGQTDTQLQFMKGSNFYLKSVIGIKTGGSGGGGASAISDLTDVDLTNLADGQVLKYNSTSQKWENANESGGSSLPFDVVINSTDNGIDIVFDDGT